MPRGRHHGHGGGGSGTSISVSSELMRTVAGSPSLSDSTLHLLQSVGAEIKNGEVSRAVITQSGIVQQLLSELEMENKNSSR